MARSSPDAGRSTTATLESSPVVYLFVYGSMRADTDFPTEYSRSFIRGCTVQAARLPGARLYFDSLSGYPAARFEEEEGIEVIGQLLSHPSMAHKMEEADRIELEGDLYTRNIVEVVVDETGERVKAWAYIRQQADTANPIECGDWLKRDKLKVALVHFMKKNPGLPIETASRALERSAGDIRLAESFVKWGIVPS